jgi:hypothetical protein
MGGAALVIVDAVTGEMSPFSSPSFHFDGLPSEHSLSVNPIDNVTVVTVFDLKLPESKPVLYVIDLATRNVTGPTVLAHVLRFQRYYS